MTSQGNLFIIRYFMVMEKANFKNFENSLKMNKNSCNDIFRSAGQKISRFL